MKKARTKHLEFIIGDIAALELAHFLMLAVNGISRESRSWEAYRQIGFLLPIIMFTAVFFTDGYRDILRRGYLREWIAVCRQIVLVFSLELVVLFLFKMTDTYSRLVLIFTFAAGICLIYTERLIIKSYLRYRFRQIKYARTLMLIATRRQAEILVHHLLSYPLTIFKIEGLAVLDEDMRGQKIEGIPVSCSKEEIDSYVASHVIDEVLLSIPGQPAYEADLARRFLSIGIVVHVYMEQYFQGLPYCQQERISELSVMTCYNREVPMWQYFCKRLMDIAGGLVGTVLAVLIGIVIGPLIYMKSPGPILFSQIRVGKNGRKFKFYKFRSMYMDAEERKKELMAQNQIQGHMFKMEHDPRILPGIGEFIRKTSLDEFPQFVNVLKGDMSLVGTRPPTVDEYEAYSFSQNKRLAIKPGLTGLWQISGRSDIKDFDEVVRLDSEYIDEWNLEMDIKIILKTVLVVLKHEGSR